MLRIISISVLEWSFDMNVYLIVHRKFGTVQKNENGTLCIFDDVYKAAAFLRKVPKTPRKELNITVRQMVLE